MQFRLSKGMLVLHRQQMAKKQGKKCCIPIVNIKYSSKTTDIFFAMLPNHIKLKRIWKIKHKTWRQKVRGRMWLCLSVGLCGSTSCLYRIIFTNSP